MDCFRISNPRLPHLQSGMITTFTAVLILVLLTLMMTFAIRVGVFEQRVSSNEMRQKRAFHAAESGVQYAKEYFKANSIVLASPIEDMLGDGTDGWLAAGNEHWLPCRGAGLDGIPEGQRTHPCFAEPDPDLRSNMYYWSYFDPLRNRVSIDVPVGSFALAAGGTETVEVQALLCVLQIDSHPLAAKPVTGCRPDVAEEDGANRYLVTILARGQADCENGANCGAESVIREQVSNFGGAAGGQAPAVPLTTKNAFPPSGAAEVVPNPNGGGLGVPISVWMNGNSACNPDGRTIYPSQGSWATCEAHEWYGLEDIPEDIECPGSCSCGLNESLSYTHGTSDVVGIDLVQDANFPCDLFQFYFGVPESSYESIKAFAKVLTNCDSLGPGSSGIYWISGSSCSVNANTVIGSAHAPVLLVSAAGTTSLAGGTKIFGVLYVSDVEKSGATFEVQGNNIVYGQVIMDAAYGNNYNGTFQIIYNENLITRVSATGGLGNVLGGWADFQNQDWDGWQDDA